MTEEINLEKEFEKIQKRAPLSYRRAKPYYDEVITTLNHLQINIPEKEKLTLIYSLVLDASDFHFPETMRITALYFVTGLYGDEIAKKVKIIMDSKKTIYIR